MQFNEIWEGIVAGVQEQDIWGFSGLIFGLLTVYFLIKKSLWTWPFGILYVLVSFVVFWQSRLYGDFLLHIFYLVLNIYGWYFWVKGSKSDDTEVGITRLSGKSALLTLGATALGVLFFAQFLIQIPVWFDGVDAAALPYWDSTTSMLSVAGMWLTARKKLDNWYYWFAVDVLATGVYFYKGLYFYAALYFLYIGMAVAGYISWKKTMLSTENR